MSSKKFNRLAFFQTDWNVESFWLFVGNHSDTVLQQIMLKINIIDKMCWVCKVPIGNYKQIYIIFLNLNNKIFISKSNGFILYSVSKNISCYIYKVPLLVKDVVLDTGLQFITDLGFETVYFGFFVLLLTTAISYISYS